SGQQIKVRSQDHQVGFWTTSTPAATHTFSLSASRDAGHAPNGIFAIALQSVARARDDPAASYACHDELPNVRSVRPSPQFAIRCQQSISPPAYPAVAYVPAPPCLLAYAPSRPPMQSPPAASALVNSPSVCLSSARAQSPRWYKHRSDT